MNERELTDSEKIGLIKIILQTKGLSGIIDFINGLQEKADKEIKTIEEPPISKVEDQGSSNHKSELSEEVASIYNAKYHDLVEKERSEFSNPEIMVSEVATPENYDMVRRQIESTRGPVLERKLPNPWGDAEAVKPGQLKL